MLSECILKMPQDIEGAGNIPRSQRSRVEIGPGVTRTGVQGAFSRHPWLHRCMLRVRAARLPIDGQGPGGPWRTSPLDLGWKLARRAVLLLLFGTLSALARVGRMSLAAKGRKPVSQLMFRGFLRPPTNVDSKSGHVHVPGFRGCDQHIHAG